MVQFGNHKGSFGPLLEASDAKNKEPFRFLDSWHEICVKTVRLWALRLSGEKSHAESKDSNEIPENWCVLWVPEGHSSRKEKQERREKGTKEVEAKGPSVELREEQTPTRTGIEPHESSNQSRDRNGEGVENIRRLIIVFPNDRRGEGDEGNTQQEQEIEDEQDRIIARDILKHAMVPQPVQANCQKTDPVAIVLGTDCEQRVKQLDRAGIWWEGCGESDIQSKQCNGNGKDGIAEERESLESKVALRLSLDG